jgi:molybdate transport system regulatory protein
MATARASVVPRPPRRCELKLRVWIVIGGRVKFGDGRAALLQRIDELGSIKKAVAEVGMSYRNVWGYLRELERAAGAKLLVRQAGGGAGSGTCLTPAGKALLARYRRVRRALTTAGERRFAQEFSGGGR